MTGHLTVRCISLESAHDRRAHMRAQLDKIGTDWAFFDACTGPPDALPYSPERARANHGRVLTKGELGCFASHWSLWQTTASLPDDNMMLVLEDDVLLDPFYFSAISDVATAAHQFGYLRLYAKVPAGVRLEGPFLDRHIARFSGRAYGTQGYFLTPRTARRWLGSIREIVRPVDDEIDRYWAHGVPILSIFPAPLIELNFGSTIEPTRRRPETLSKVQRLRWETNKALEKVRRLASDGWSKLFG